MAFICTTTFGCDPPPVRLYPPDEARYAADAGRAEQDGALVSTLEYVAAVRPAFDDLKDVAAQLAGVLLLAACGSRHAAGHPMIAPAAGGRERADARLRTMLVPPPGRHSHAHLLAASDALKATIEQLNRKVGTAGVDVEAVFRPLTAAHRELGHSCTGLPGIEMVPLAQGCGCHLAARI